MSGPSVLLDLPLPRTDAASLLPEGAVVRRTIPFARAWGRWREPAYRRLLTAWILLVLAVAPLGMVTRWLEWTGIPVTLGGTTVFVTIYLPLLGCLPLVFWLGYLWAAVPAYLSTFLVALIGGMPPGWALVFAFANPVGLAVVALAYRSLPVRIDLRSGSSALFYVLVLFVSSLAGSGGAFVWAHTNQVGFHDIYPVWQGWWLGGLLQAVVFVGPLLALASPVVERWKRGSGLEPSREEIPSRRDLIVSPLVIASGLGIYVLVVRSFSRRQLEEILAGVGDPGLEIALGNVFDGLVLPQYVLLFFALFTAVFGVRAGTAWSASLRRAAERLRDLNLQLEAKNRELTRLAATDPLTGLANRARLMERMELALAAASRHDRPLAFVLLDLDHFKSINDRFGHLVGDAVLVEVARRLEDRLRREDLAARFGGEEMALLLPDTDAEGARNLAEAVRTGLAEEPVRHGDVEVDVSASFGVAVRDGASSETADRLIARADEALYRAKDEGRNRTVLAPAAVPLRAAASD